MNAETTFWISLGGILLSVLLLRIWWRSLILARVMAILVAVWGISLWKIGDDNVIAGMIFKPAGALAWILGAGIAVAAPIGLLSTKLYIGKLKDRPAAPTGDNDGVEDFQQGDA